MNKVFIFITLSFLSSIAVNAQNSDNLLSEGKTFYKMGNYDKCILMLDSAVKTTGNSSPEIQFYLIKSLFNLSNYNRADAEITKYFKMNPVQDNFYTEISSIKTQLADILPKKIFYDEKWQVCTEDKAAFYRLIQIDPNRSTGDYLMSRGPVKDYYITGELQSEIESANIHKTIDAKSYFYGKTQRFYKSGKKAGNVSYNNYGLYINYIYYYENGNIRAQFEGKRWGDYNRIQSFKTIMYYENGSLDYDIVFNNDKNIYDNIYKTIDTVYKGKKVYPNGDSFRGTFTKKLNDLKPNGYGKMTFADGSSYEGYWENGVRKNGEGIMVYKDGSKYRGEWVDNKRSGFGWYTMPGGQEKSYVWANDQIQQNSFIFENNLEYKIFLAFSWYDATKNDWKISGWYEIDTGKKQIFNFGIDPTSVYFHARLTSGSYSDGRIYWTEVPTIQKINVELNNGFNRYASEKPGTPVNFGKLEIAKIEASLIIWKSGYVLLENRSSHQVNIALALYNEQNNDYQLIGWYVLNPGDKRNMNFERPLDERKCYYFTEWKDGNSAYSETCRQRTSWLDDTRTDCPHEKFNIGPYGVGFNYYRSNSTGSRTEKFYYMDRPNTGGPIHYIHKNLK